MHHVIKAYRVISVTEALSFTAWTANL
uniref:Uncharacterized protein n=1 Tax=Anguilla anguilla TaxID=7936 RepID=A0A0E9S3H6_ANGAN